MTCASETRDGKAVTYIGTYIGWERENDGTVKTVPYRGAWNDTPLLSLWYDACVVPDTLPSLRGEEMGDGGRTKFAPTLGWDICCAVLSFP